MGISFSGENLKVRGMFKTLANIAKCVFCLSVLCGCDGFVERTSDSNMQGGENASGALCDRGRSTTLKACLDANFPPGTDLITISRYLLNDGFNHAYYSDKYVDAYQYDANNLGNYKVRVNIRYDASYKVTEITINN